MSKKQQSNLAQAFRHAASGIVQAIKIERSIKIELACAVFALLVSALLALEPLEWVAIVILIVIVLALELANSALESLVDLVQPAEHPLAKHTKDAMAGAVLIAAIGAAVCGCLIFINAAVRLWG